MNNSQDNIQKRREEILNYINEKGRTTVNDISEALRISAITVRRDLDALTAEKRVSRYFGGVKALPAPKPEPPAPVPCASTFSHRLLAAQPPQGKQEVILKIARSASELIDDGDVIFMNNSLTASYVLEYLGNKSVVVITNCLFTLARNMGPNIKLCFLGGQLQPDRASLTGGMTTDALSRITAGKCIMGVDGIDLLSGLTCKVLEESYINQRMIEQTTGKRIVVAEGSRIACKSAFYSGALRDISFLITDDSADSTEISHFTNSGLMVHMVHSY